MPLSEYEQRVLEQMERQLSSDDPKLVNTFQGRGRRSVRRWLLTGIGAVAGLVLLVVGVMQNAPLLGVVGFIAMFTSVVLAFTPPRRSGPHGVVQEDGRVQERPGRQGGGGPGFLARLEERWDRRRDEGGR